MAKNLSFSIAINLLTENFKKGANAVKSTFKSMQMQILTFAAALGAGGIGLMGLISRMKDVARETNRVVTALRNVSGGTAQFTDNLKFLNSLANKYGLGINILTGAYAKFTASATNAGVSIENQKKIFESVSRANAAFALSSDESSGVMLALSQMMGKGKISSEELRKQMGEKLPVAMAAMAKAAGTTIGGLEPLLKQGKLMAADILPKFADALNEIIPNVDTDNIETSLNRLSNVFNKFTESVGIGNKFKVIIDALTGLIESASKNIQNIILGIVAAIVFVVSNGATKVWRSYQSVGNQIIANAEAANNKMVAATAARVEAEIALDKAKSAAFFATEKQRLQTTQAVTKAELALKQRLAAEIKAIEANTLASSQAAAIKTGGFWATTGAMMKGAFLKLGTAIKSMWNTFAPAIIITVVTTLIYKIYELVTATSKAQKAVEDFNSEARSQEKELNGVFNAYKKANDGTKEKAQLLDIIKSKYGEYIQGLIDEKGNIRDIEEAQRLANKALKESIALKVKNAAINEVSTEEIEKQAKTLRKLRETIALSEGDEAANIMSAHIGSLFNDDKKSSNKAIEEALNYIDNQGVDRMQQTSSFMSKTVWGLVHDLGRSSDKIKKETQDIENSFRGLVGDVSNPIDVYLPDTNTDKPSSYGKLYKDAKKEWDDAKKELASIEKDKDRFTKEQYENAKNREKTAKDAFENLGGNTKNNDSAYNKSEKLAENKLEALRKLDEADRQRQIDKIAFDNEMRQKSIDNMEDGFLKEFAQLKLNNDRELQEIEEYKKRIAKAQVEEIKNQYVSKHGNIKGFESYLTTVNFDDVLPDGLKPQSVNAQIKQLTDAASAALQSGLTKLKKELATFQDEERLRFASQLDQQLYDIKVHYEKRLQLAKGNAALTKQIIENQNKETKAAVLQALGRQLDFEIQYNQKVKELVSDRHIFEADKRRESLEQELADQKKIYNNLDRQVWNDPNNADLVEKWKAAGIQIKLINKELSKTKAEKLREIAQGASEIFSSLRDTLGDFGISFSDNINAALDGVGKTLDGLASIDVTKPVSIITGGLKALGGVAQTVTGLFGGADYSEYDELKSKYENLLDIWNELIDKKKEYLSTSTADEVNRTEKEILDMIKNQEETARKLAQSRLDSGSSMGSHSLWYRMWKGSYKFDGKNWRDVAKEISSELGGVKFDGMSDILNMTAEQLQWIKENYSGLWSVMDGDFRGYLEQLIQYGDQAIEVIKQAKEQLTGVSFDNLKDTFLNTLSDMDSSAKDFADDFSSYLQKAILKAMLDKTYADRLEAWYDSFADANRDGVIDKGEYERLRREWDSIVNDSIADRDKLKELFGWTSEGEFSQDSSKGYSVGMDQDTGGAILGRVTGLHETGLRMESILSGISMSTTNIFSQNVSINNELQKQTVLLDEIKQIQTKSFFQMEEMGETLENAVSKLDKIDKNTKGL